MRKCIRCGTQMKENCSVKIEGEGFYYMEISSDDKKIFGNKIGKPKAAVCPNCGELSFYIEDVNKVK